MGESKQPTRIGSPSALMIGFFCRYSGAPAKWIKDSWTCPEHKSPDCVAEFWNKEWIDLVRPEVPKSMTTSKSGNRADQLRAEYEAALKELQDACQHVWGEWMPYMWAPGHISGRARGCRLCNFTERDRK